MMAHSSYTSYKSADNQHETNSARRLSKCSLSSVTTQGKVGLFLGDTDRQAARPRRSSTIRRSIKALLHSSLEDDKTSIATLPTLQNQSVFSFDECLPFVKQPTASTARENEEVQLQAVGHPQQDAKPPASDKSHADNECFEPGLHEAYDDTLLLETQASSTSDLPIIVPSNMDSLESLLLSKVVEDILAGIEQLEEHPCSGSISSCSTKDSLALHKANWNKS